MPDRIFTPPALPTGGWQDVLLLALAALFVATLARIRVEARHAEAGVYSARLAWLRVLLYGCASTILAIVTGVFALVFTSPLTTATQLADAAWLAFAAACLAVELVAYGVVWRAGTRSYGRARHLRSIALVGVLWGLSEAQVFLSIWAIVESFVSDRLLIVVISFVLIASFKGLWQSLYWDVRVSPPHNLPEWNLRKVLFAHVPNLLITLTYLAVTGSAAMFVAFQVVAILISAYVMRFPAWADRTAR